MQQGTAAGQNEERFGCETRRPGFTGLPFHHLTLLWSGANSEALLSKPLLCRRREGSVAAQAENGSDTGHHCNSVWSSLGPGRKGGGSPRLLLGGESVKPERGPIRGLSKGRGDKGPLLKNIGEWRRGPKCQHPELSTLSPRS